MCSGLVIRTFYMFCMWRVSNLFTFVFSVGHLKLTDTKEKGVSLQYLRPYFLLVPFHRWLHRWHDLREGGDLRSSYVCVVLWNRRGGAAESQRHHNGPGCRCLHQVGLSFTFWLFMPGSPTPDVGWEKKPLKRFSKSQMLAEKHTWNVIE